MGMHVISYLLQTLKRKDKEKDRSGSPQSHSTDVYNDDDNDWDFGARQTPDLVLTPSTSSSHCSTSMSASASAASTSSTRQARRRSISLINVNVHGHRPSHSAVVTSADLSPRDSRSSALRGSASAAYIQKRGSVSVATESRMRRSPSGSVNSNSRRWGLDRDREIRVHSPEPSYSPHSPRSPRSLYSPITRLPEEDVLLYAGEIAKESRSLSNGLEGFDTFAYSDTRRRTATTAATTTRARTRSSLSSSARLPSMRHASSDYSIREAAATANASAPVFGTRTATTANNSTIPPVPPNSPTPSIYSFRSAASQLDNSYSSDSASVYAELNRRTLLQAKRSLPILVNVWENFLEEASEDADSFVESPKSKSPVTSIGRSERNGRTERRESRSRTAAAATMPTAQQNMQTHTHHVPPTIVNPNVRSSSLNANPSRISEASPSSSSSSIPRQQHRSRRLSSNTGSTSSIAAFSSFSSTSSRTTVLTNESLHNMPFQCGSPGAGSGTGTGRKSDVSTMSRVGDEEDGSNKNDVYAIAEGCSPITPSTSGTHVQWGYAL